MNPFSNLGEKDDSLIDWSSETLASSSSMPILRISLVGEHVLLPYAPSSQSNSNGNNISK